MSGSVFGDLTVIANPRAGQGRVGARLPALERALAANDLPYTLHVVAGPNEAGDVARKALESGGRYLVAVGGDGTVQEIVNGMFEDGRTVATDPVLGVVPADAECELLRSFSIPGDVEGACAHLRGTETYPLDVMKVTWTTQDGERATRYSHNLARIGFGASAAVRAARLSPRFGRARQFLGFWLALARTKLATVRVEVDRGGYEGPAYEVVVANAQYASGGLRLSPRSFPGDGVIECLVFTGPRSDAVTMLPRVFRHGDHVPDPHIREYRAKIRVAIDADRPLPIVADGEALGTTPATFQVVPRQILLKL